MAVFLTGAGVLPVLGKKASDYAVGENVFLNVNGASTEFLVVQQGLPSSVYDTSCDGTWLLMKDIYDKRQWNNSYGNNSYANSTIHSYLNNTFINLFDSNIIAAIKSVKLPYTVGTGPSTTIASGANGISAKVFLLSLTEVGLSDSYANIEGSALAYFKNAANSLRIGYLNGTAASWAVRSPYNNNSYSFWHVTPAGTNTTYTTGSTSGNRPCVILPYDTLFDPDTNEVKV